MDWMQVAAIIGVNVTLVGALATLIIWTVNKLDADVRSIGNRLDTLGSRLDGHAMRIDQLYKMFVDLLQNRK